MAITVAVVVLKRLRQQDSIQVTPLVSTEGEERIVDAASERSRIRANLARRVTEMFGEARAPSASLKAGSAVAGELDRIADVIWRVRQLRPTPFESLTAEQDEP